MYAKFTRAVFDELIESGKALSRLHDATNRVAWPAAIARFGLSHDESSRIRWVACRKWTDQLIYVVSGLCERDRCWKNASHGERLRIALTIAFRVARFFELESDTYVGTKGKQAWRVPMVFGEDAVELEAIR